MPRLGRHSTWQDHYNSWGKTSGQIVEQLMRIANRKRKSGVPTKANKRRKVSVKARSRAGTTANALGSRVAVKTKGRKQIRSIVHRKRPVKVSRPLRKKIQKVIDGGAYKGTYTTTRFGTIGITNSSNTGPTGGITNVTTTAGGYNNQLMFQKQQKDNNGHNRWWFAQGLQTTAQSSAASLVSGSEWQFFSPLKIVDAASVLWNTKPIDVNYALQGKNLNTVVVEATGVPVVGQSSSDPQIKGLKIQIDNCYVKFTMKNNSQRQMIITVYNCVPKIKFPSQLPLTALQAGIISEADGANSAYLSAVTTGFTAFEDAQALFVNPSFNPNLCRAFTASWKYEKKIIRIAPGEVMTHSVQGPRGFTLDYRKLYDSGDNKQGFCYKGTTMCVMMSVEADLVFTTEHVGTGQGGITGHYVPNISAENALVEPISLQWEEVYRLSCPDIVGFTKNAIGDTAGESQLLNLRIPRRAFGNFTQVGSSTNDPAHADYDKENPAIKIEDQ